MVRSNQKFLIFIGAALLVGFSVLLRKRIAKRDDYSDPIFGYFKGKVRIVGDIVAPAVSPEEWGDLYP